MADEVLDTKTIRTRLNDMPQAAFADIAHVDQSTVSLWETDKNAPSRAAAALIEQHCAANGVEVAWKPAKSRAA